MICIFGFLSRLFPPESHAILMSFVPGSSDAHGLSLSPSSPFPLLLPRCLFPLYSLPPFPSLPTYKAISPLPVPPFPPYLLPHSRHLCSEKWRHTLFLHLFLPSPCHVFCTPYPLLSYSFSSRRGTASFPRLPTPCLPPPRPSLVLFSFSPHTLARLPGPVSCVTSFTPPNTHFTPCFLPSPYCLRLFIMLS